VGGANSIRLIILAAALAALLIGCGSPDQGSPGGWGSEDTNMLVGAEVTPDSDQVDVCGPGDVGAIANITAEAIDEDLPENTLYLEGYKVSYSTSSVGAPPLASASYLKSGTLPAGSLSVVLIDGDSKQRYLKDVTSGGYSPSEEFPTYTAGFEFYGEDIYGSGFGVVASVTFSIGRYTACTPSLTPGAVSLAGLSNPDGDASDDITFHVSGGIAPYTVYSDNGNVIEAPGELGPGVGSFTVDPDSVGSDTTVTLTVLDSESSAATSSVTVVSPASSLSISPEAISLTGLSNTGGDASDNITFHISGGTGPYTVYSDNGNVIEAPGELGPGVSSFTVDPDSVGSDTTVVLTVLDSVSNTATASVTVTP
jgi:hypothetical protein